VPSPDVILTGLATIANDWRWLAIAWHVLLVGVTAVLIAGWRPSNRLAGWLLITPVFSVSLLALVSGNPFNATVFAMLAAMLLAATARFSNATVRVATRAWFAAGSAFIVFGSTYPHFLETQSWTTYLYAAPFGLVPCPTLAVVIGVTIACRSLRATLWSAALVVAGLAYGAIGVFRLGVALDWALLFASATLAAAVAYDHRSWRSVRANRPEPSRSLPRDDLSSATPRNAHARDHHRSGSQAMVSFQPERHHS
jgi:hypothetical protein